MMLYRPGHKREPGRQSAEHIAAAAFLFVLK